MARLDELFKKMVNDGASDLHLTTGTAPSFRVDGSIRQLPMNALTPEATKALIFEILSEQNRERFLEKLELDCAYQVDNVGRFRCNIFMQRKGMAAVFRHIPTKILSAEQLGLPQAMIDMVNVHKGLILVTGPTGSGKSTTLAALVDWINANHSHHILTVEDPIEFTHENKKSLVNQREVGNHTKSFKNALKAALREDPDIILVGEMRDIETISLAITAAETGHVVFGTLHTMSAPKTVDRVIDVFPEDRQSQIRAMLSESLRGVIAQTLFPKAGGKGRVAAHEILFNTSAVANLIRESKTFQIPSIMQTSKNMGMQTFNDSIGALMKAGTITKEIGSAYLGKLSGKDEEPANSSSSSSAPKEKKASAGMPPLSGAAGSSASSEVESDDDIEIFDDSKKSRFKNPFKKTS